jgi:integrase
MAPRTYPSVKRLWYKGRDGVKRLTSTYFINYTYRGKRIREKTGKTSAKEAYEILLQRRQETRTGRLIGPKAERVSLETLEQLVVDNYASRGRRTPAMVIRRRFAPLRAFFVGAKPLHITSADLDAYIVHRQGCVSRRGTPVSMGTIHNELANLQRGYTIAVRSKLLPEAPRFPKMAEENARKVFIDRSALSLLLEHLPEDVRPIFEVALLTGWRKEAILSRQRSHVDFKRRWLRLDSAWSKNGKPVTVYLNRPLRAVLVLQERKARQLERQTGRIIPWLFFYYRDGKVMKAGDQVKDMDGSFRAAREKAGIPHVHFHDLRRGAIRTMRRAGLSEHEIMETVGLRTRSVFDRYDIIDEERKRETGARLEAYWDEEGRKAPKVIPIRGATKT